jgi:hypothetical protein
VQGARLRLRVVDAGPDAGTLYAVSNHFANSSTPWTESALRFTNAPPLPGTALGAMGAVSANTWIEFDVTSAVTGNGTFSFAITSASSNTVGYSSSEGANSPQLVVVASSGSASAQAVPPSGEEPDRVPGIVELLGNRPNPFGSQTTIQYALPRAANVRLVIFDVRGRVVRTLVDGAQGAGPQFAIWDGKDDRGSVAAAGTYIYRLEADGTRLTRKLSLLR